MVHFVLYATVNKAAPSTILSTGYFILSNDFKSSTVLEINEL